MAVGLAVTAASTAAAHPMAAGLAVASPMVVGLAVTAAAVAAAAKAVERQHQYPAAARPMAVATTAARPIMADPFESRKPAP